MGERGASHRLLGLATYSMRLGDFDRARRMLALAERAGVDPFAVLMGRARLALLEGDADAAIACLDEARGQDPFDEDASDLLGQVLADGRDPRAALECFIDARAVAGGTDPDRDRAYEAAIARLAESADLSPAERALVERERRSRLEELALEAEELALDDSEPILADPVARPGLPDGDVGGAAAATSSRLGSDAGVVAGPTAERPMRDVLRVVTPFSRLAENELRLLECTMDRLRFAAGQAVFREGQPSEDLFVVESGTIVIQRETPFGSQVLATIGPSGLFGEMNFIDGRSRSADAVAPEGAVLLRIAHESLRRIFDVESGLAFVFLEQFWRGLSDKVREGNELMKSFFTDDGQPPPSPPPTEADPETTMEIQAGAAGREEGMAHDQKASVLSEKGLSGDEMRILAEFAEPKTFDSGQAIFSEGDPGGAIYIVFEGRVRIEKHIPGAGQEALAILERGDFFGEMSVIDDAARSASAIAHESATTVLAISKAAIDRLLETRGATAHLFLLILCRILSTRLREINDKIVQWRFMSGGF